MEKKESLFLNVRFNSPHLQGRKLLTKAIPGNSTSVNLNLPVGIYLVNVNTQATRIVVTN